MANLRPLVVTVGLSILLPLGSSCGPRGVASRGPSPSSVVTADEIEASGVRNAWEAIRYHFRFVSLTESRRRRPAEMTYRGRSSILLDNGPIVVVDGARISEIDVLVDIPAQHIALMRMLSSFEGTTYYGTNAGNGVILIETKHKPDP